MIGTIYSSSAGMTTFSEALDIVGNNVSNMNTPGFKGQDMVFKDLFYENQTGLQNDGSRTTDNKGHGSDIATTVTRTSQGELRETGSDTDLAVDGNGFFVLMEDDGNYFTRAGRFEFDKDNILVDSVTGAEVAGISADGELEKISISGLKSNPAQATTHIDFTGTLNSNMDDGDTYTIPDDSDDPDEAAIHVYDSYGDKHQLIVKFTKTGFVEGSTTQMIWMVEISEKDGEVLATEELRYESGTPMEDYDSVLVELSAESGAAASIEVDFSNTQMLSASSSNVEIKEDEGIDGIPIGSLISIDFSEEGKMTLNYSNGESVDGQQVALAIFQDIQSLELIGDNLYKATSEEAPVYGKAGTIGLGDIIGGKVELSNVELSQEFTDIIIAQRGYQACSHLLSVSNEMIQQLFELGGKR